MTQDKGKLVHSHPANELTEKHFGFESVICKEKEQDSTGITITINSDAVPTGKIWKITHITAFNVDGDIATRHQFSLMSNSTEIEIAIKVESLARYQTHDKHVELYLNKDDYIRARFEGVASGETCRLNIFGYEMNAP